MIFNIVPNIIMCTKYLYYGNLSVFYLDLGFRLTIFLMY
jgi:hypothetical protein